MACPDAIEPDSAKAIAQIMNRFIANRPFKKLSINLGDMRIDKPRAAERTDQRRGSHGEPLYGTGGRKPELFSRKTRPRGSKWSLSINTATFPLRSQYKTRFGMATKSAAAGWDRSAWHQPFTPARNEYHRTTCIKIRHSHSRCQRTPWGRVSHCVRSIELTSLLRRRSSLSRPRPAAPAHPRDHKCRAFDITPGDVSVWCRSRSPEKQPALSSSAQGRSAARYQFVAGSNPDNPPSLPTPLVRKARVVCWLVMHLVHSIQVVVSPRPHSWSRGLLSGGVFNQAISIPQRLVRMMRSICRCCGSSPGSRRAFAGWLLKARPKPAY